MLSPDELLKLASAYAKATGLSLTSVGRISCNNDKIFVRLGDGRGASTRSVEQATGWFETNWPKGMRWPKGVPGGPRGAPRRPASPKSARTPTA